MRIVIDTLRRNRLFLQLLFRLLAAGSLAGISIVLISDAIRSAESVVLGNASKTLTDALRELTKQELRVGRDSAWRFLSEQTKDLKLRGITQSVLRAYPGVEGGFHRSDEGFLGYSYPTHDTGAVMK